MIVSESNRVRIISKIGPNLRPRSRRVFLAIVNAAQQHFLEKGFDSVSMEGIAKSANTTKRTVYQHFEDKKALFAAVVQILCSKVVTPPLDEFKTESTGPREFLCKLGVHFLSGIYSKEQIQLFRLVITDANKTPELGKLMFEQVNMLEQSINDYLARQQEKGLLQLPCSEMAASQFLGLLKTDTQMKLLFGKKKRITKTEIEHIVECCVELFLNGVAQPSSDQ